MEVRNTDDRNLNMEDRPLNTNRKNKEERPLNTNRKNKEGRHLNMNKRKMEDRHLNTEDRHFPNPYPDYTPDLELYNFETNELQAQIKEKLISKGLKLVLAIEKLRRSKHVVKDRTIYTGAAGIAFLYMKISQVRPPLRCLPKRGYLTEARGIVDRILPNLKRKVYSFLCGAPGVLSISAIIYHKRGMTDLCYDYMRRVENLEEFIRKFNKEMSDEIIYGRAGYLYCLLYLTKHGPDPDYNREIVLKSVISKILEMGKFYAKSFQNTYKIPLFFKWHQRQYLGAAHGYVGILHLLLQAKPYISQEDLNNLVRPCVDFLADQKLPSGNYRSSMGSPNDRLVQWCHGAPGFVFLFVAAYQTFEDEKYLTAAKEAADVVWQRGILRKGYGLCHGTAGNAYAFLCLFQATRDQKYLYYAIKFAEWCFAYGKHGCRNPDRPLSLYEGAAGVAYFFIDLLNPMEAKFPGFQL